jgi:hypothetical protein
MSDESEFDCGEDILETDDSGDCDYGFEFCEDPFLRSIGNCFECRLYQEVCEAEEEERAEKEEIKQQVRNPT